MRSAGVVRRRRLALLHWFLIASAASAGLGLLVLTLRSLEPSPDLITNLDFQLHELVRNNDSILLHQGEAAKSKGCATVEEMGQIFTRGFQEENIRARKIIHDHFILNGASRVRALPPEIFCKHGFVLGKASEAGFGNEMYKILTGAALSVMLNRSLIIGQTRKKYPFGEYISYSNVSFTLKEVKHLWRQNDCVTRYGRHLVMRIDDFLKPTKTNVLCSNWKKWDEPIIWFQNTTDAVASQFFLKNIHAEMRDTAFNLFGRPEELQYRPNVFGELMRILISPSENVEHAVNWALSGGDDPDVALHMRMLMNRPVRAVRAALNCIRKALGSFEHQSKPKIAIVSDTPSFIKDIRPDLEEFAEVVYFNYGRFEGNISDEMNTSNNFKLRVKDWGPAPRWVAFVDFFLASRAKHALVSGANRRVGTTYAQLVAALAAARRLEEAASAGSSFTFLSSFQSNLVSEGLKNQIGWGHVWNRFAGPLSCHKQSNQCAFTPVLPPAWWDGLWQSPIPRDVRRMNDFGIRLSGLGTVDDHQLLSYCTSRKKSAISTVVLI